MYSRRYSPVTNKFFDSNLLTSDFPESIRETAKELYFGDKSALQGYNLFEYVGNRTSEIEETQFDIQENDISFPYTGMYYGYVLSCKLCKNGNWFKVRVLIDSETVKTILVKSDISAPINKRIIRSFGCPITDCVHKMIKFYINNVEHEGKLKSFVQTVDSVSVQEKEMVYYAINNLLIAYG